MKTTKKSMNSIRKEKSNMKAIITRNDQTAVLELPTSRMELAGSLSRIGIRTPAYIIPCSDEEEYYIKVKLFGESDFENELTALVTPKDSLGSVNTALDLYRELPQTQKEKLNAELSQNPPDSLSSLCHKVMDFQPTYVTEDYYFPLTVSMNTTNIKTPPLIRLCVQGQLHGNRRPLFRAFLNTNLAAVQCDDFPHQR